MDELFDRIKAIKIKRKYLVANLIATEILGILVFIWILKVPLYQKFFIIQPKAYSISQMDDKKRYLLTQGDYLTSQANPNNKIVMLIWENSQIQQKSKVKLDLEGNWIYQLPPALEPGIKVITVGELDSSNNIWSIKNYRIRVKPKDLLNLTKAENREILLSNIASVQEEIIKTASDITVNEIYSPSLTISTLSRPVEE